MCANSQIALENPITVTDPRIHACGTFCARLDPAHPPTKLPAAIVAAIGPEVTTLEPGDKVLYPRSAGFEVRLVRSPHRVRVMKREDLIARVHD